MTITYAQEVGSSKRTGNFVRLLFRWKGSVYKLVWPDMFLYFSIYFIVNFYYRFVLVPIPTREDERRYFESLVRYCRRYASEIPLSFILGFYVTIVIGRWWSVFQSFPWPDSLAYHISTIIRGSDERSRLFRRSMMRYINLSFVLTMGMICPGVKLRFPTLEHCIKAGILLPHEKIIIETLNLRSKHPKYWVPLIWASNIASRARRESRIADDISMNLLVSEIVTFRGKLGDMLGYDWVNVPLVYTQAVTVATYLYFVANLLGKQFLKDQEDVDSIDIYIPVFQIFEFLFYMGWLRVAETLINPFGSDDDDFEVNYLVDRNFQTSYFIVDELYNDHPLLIKDAFWNSCTPDRLPYTKACLEYKEQVFVGTAMGHTSSTQYKDGDTQYFNFENKKREPARAEEPSRQHKEPQSEEKSGATPTEATAPVSEEETKDVETDPATKAKYEQIKSDLEKRVALITKQIAERRKQGSEGLWDSMTGPILSNPAIFYEPEYPIKYVPPVKVHPGDVAVKLAPRTRTEESRKPQNIQSSDSSPKVTQPKHHLKKVRSD